MRLIDADALKRRVGELIVPEWARTLIRTWLESAPTVDAVPVVRCGECKHWDKWVCDKDGGHECVYNGGVWMEDEFCSDGERNRDVYEV